MLIHACRQNGLAIQGKQINIHFKGSNVVSLLSFRGRQRGCMYLILALRMLRQENH